MQPIPSHYIAWICMVHLALFACILFLKKENRKANRTLGLFMLILSSIHLSHILILSGAVFRLHWLNELCFFLLYFEGPLYLQFTADMTGEKINWKKYGWLHALPFIPPLLYVINFLFKESDYIRTYYEQATIRQPPDALLLLSIVTVQMGIYLVWSLRLLHRYDRRIHSTHYHRIMSLRWLYQLTLALLFFSFVAVPIMLLFVKSDLHVLYVYMPIITMAIYLVLFYKSISFPGTEFEKKLIRNQERDKISRDVHDELGAGITRIALLSEIAKREMGPGISQLDEISRNARRLAESLREIIWGLDPENNTFSQLMAYLREYMNNFLEDARIQCSIHFPTNLPDTPVSPELRRNISMIVKEALNNIVRHSGASNVNINLTLDDQFFSLNIQDNGKGLGTPNASSGNGLHNMQKRTENLGGKFTLSSTTGKGTSITISGISLNAP